MATPPLVVVSFLVAVASVLFAGMTLFSRRGLGPTRPMLVLGVATAAETAALAGKLLLLNGRVDFAVQILSVVVLVIAGFLFYRTWTLPAPGYHKHY